VHVKQEVQDTSVHEQIRKELPYLETLAQRIESEYRIDNSDQMNRPNSKHPKKICQQKNGDVRNEQTFNHRGKKLKTPEK